MASKKAHAGYQQKTVKFGGKDLVMYSIDGVTWSTRPDELQSIVDRHNQEKAICSSDLKGEEREDGARIAPLRPAKKLVPVKAADDDADEDDIEIDDAEIGDIDDDGIGEEMPIDDGDDDVEEAPASRKNTPVKAPKGGKPAPIIAKAAAKVVATKGKAPKLPEKKAAKAKPVAQKKPAPAPKKRTTSASKSKKPAAKSGRRKAA